MEFYTSAHWVWVEGLYKLFERLGLPDPSHGTRREVNEWLVDRSDMFLFCLNQKIKAKTEMLSTYFICLSTDIFCNVLPVTERCDIGVSFSTNVFLFLFTASILASIQICGHHFCRSVRVWKMDASCCAHFLKKVKELILSGSRALMTLT